MNGKEYTELAMRTNDGKGSERLTKILTETTGAGWRDNTEISIGGILNGALGLTGEAGEVSDMLKKWIFHEKELDVEHLKKELGDVMWYMAMLCDSFGFDLDEILQMNIDKLKKRYPSGFDTVRANNRAEGDV